MPNHQSQLISGCSHACTLFTRHSGTQSPDKLCSNFDGLTLQVAPLLHGLGLQSSKLTLQVEPVHPGGQTQL